MFDSIQTLNGMKDSGYQGVDARSAVRYLLDGIQDSSLDATRNAILTDAALRTDFTRCVELFQEFLNQKAANDPKPSLNVSVVDAKKTDKKRRNDGPGPKKGKLAWSSVTMR